MSTNGVPLLTDLCLHVYEGDALQGLLKNSPKPLIKT